MNPLQPSVPMKQMIYRGVQWRVERLPDGNKALVFDTPMEQIVLPLDDRVAMEMGTQLRAPTIVQGTVMPVNGKGK
jgi:hypothetical protein